MRVGWEVEGVQDRDINNRQTGKTRGQRVGEQNLVGQKGWRVVEGPAEERKGEWNRKGK